MPVKPFTVRGFAALVLSAISACAAPAFAQDSGVVYAGGSAGDGWNAYGGAVVALPGGRLGEGLAIRGGGGGGEYRYTSNGVRIDASYVSAELALVYQTSGQWGWANFSAGPRITDTSLTPSDPANDLAGTRVDVALQTDGAVGSSWRLGWFGSLGGNDGTYVTEARFGPLLDAPSQTRAGIEGGIQGDDTYTTRKVGAFVSTQFQQKWEARLSGGITDQDARGTKPYASVGVSHVF